MSKVVVTDKRGGVFEVVMTFTYGECDRLPYNAMRKVNARIEQVKNGGIQATADFNVRNEKEAANFVEVLDLFGDDGSFVHGSPASNEVLPLDAPPDEEDESGIPAAAAGEKRGRKSGSKAAVPSPKFSASKPAQGAVGKKSEDADDLEVETEEAVEVEEGDDEVVVEK